MFTSLVVKEMTLNTTAFMLLFLAILSAAKRHHQNHKSYARLLEMLNNGDTENYDAELAKLKSHNSANARKRAPTKQDYEKVALSELRRIRFYLRLLTDKFVPKADQERALKDRLERVKAELAPQKAPK